MSDLLAWLKWPEFRRAEREVCERLERQGDTAFESAFADSCERDGDPLGPALIAVGSSRLMVVTSEGAFVRRAGELVLSAAKDHVSVLWEFPRSGYRMKVRAPAGDVVLWFGPLWRYEAHRLMELTDECGGWDDEL